MMSSKEAGLLVQSSISKEILEYKRGKNAPDWHSVAKRSAEAVVVEAMSRKSADNLTVIVVLFKSENLEMLKC